MKKSLIVAILLSAFMYAEAGADSIWGRDVDSSKQNQMVSLFGRYSPTAYVALGNDEIINKYDTEIIDVGVNITGALYTRLYFSLDFYARMATVDDSEYGEGDIKAFGGGVGAGLVHKTFFGKGNSYDIGANVGIDVFGSIDVTSPYGSQQKTSVQNSTAEGFFFEPTIGITYDPFSILVGYKVVTTLYNTDGMPTITVRYFF